MVNGVAEVADRLETSLGAVQDRIDRARSTIDNVMWLTTAVLLLLVAYVAVLNVIIIRQARRGPVGHMGVEPAVAGGAGPVRLRPAGRARRPHEESSPPPADEVPSPPPADAT